ncbi:MFS transporter [Desulfoscipio gibsoniae]|uniref:MFS transporter n=1 Tax=Desulfoscipio gibsoniae TaxID=102134 RepID=UPI00248075E6|nr:MFS transporter [Desulfoscipio gibsoniae]
MFLLCIGEIFLMMGLSFIAPILPKFIQSLGVEASKLGISVGLTITAFGIARVAMNIPSGKITKRFGRRLLLVGAPAIVFISALGCGFTTAYWQLIVWRLLQGAAAAGYSVTALIALAEISNTTNRGLYISYFWTAALLGASIGPTFGGFMGEYFGYRFVFFCYAALALLSAIWVYLRVPETSTRHQGVGLTRGATVLAETKKSTGYLFNYNFILISLVALFTLVTIGGTQATLIPLVGYENLSLSEGQVGLGLTVIAIMQVLFSPIAGNLSDKLGRKKLIIPGGVITVLGLIMFVYSSTYWFFLFCALILGLGRGIGAPIPTAYVSDIALKDDYEGTLATFRAISDLGWVIGPLLCGYLKDISGLILPFYLTAGMLLMTVALFGIFGKETIKVKAAQV